MIRLLDRQIEIITLLLIKDDYCAADKLAEALSVPTRVIHKLIKDKKLRCFVIGSSKRITRNMLEEYIEKNELK